MKTNIFASTLIAAALLSTSAYAATDGVAASFERDLQRGIIAEPRMGVVKDWHDPLGIVNTIFGNEPDAVVASFDRDLYRQPVHFAAVGARADDPLDAINVAFRSTESNAILASFQRDLYREGVYSAVLPIRYDDPLHAINIALWREMKGDPAAHLLIVRNYYSER